MSKNHFQKPSDLLLQCWRSICLNEIDRYKICLTDGSGYVDHGADIFDDEEDEEGDVMDRKSKRKKKDKKGKPVDASKYKFRKEERALRL